MATTPLTNPINAAPVPAEQVDQRVEEQRVNLTPENIGEAIHNQVQSQSAETAAAAAAAAAQAINQVANPLLEQINQMRTDMAADRAQPPAPAAPVAPPPDHSYSDEELAEMGRLLPGAIDKRAAAAALAMRDEAVALARQEATVELTKLRADIDELRATTAQNTNQNVQSFQAQAMAFAQANQIDVSALPNDKAWIDLMNEPVSQLSSQTFGQTYDAAYKAQDARQIGQIFQIFSQRNAAAAQAANPAAPQPAAGGARMTPDAGAGATADEQEFQTLVAERKTLSEQRQLRRITPDQYAAGVSAVDAKLAALAQKLNPQPT